MERREFIKKAANGTGILALGGVWWWLDDDLTRRAAAQTRPDGRPRLPEGQRVIRKLRPMGGSRGDQRKSRFRLRIHGEVDNAMDLDFAHLLALPQEKLKLDVHCVTGWSVMGARFEGVPLYRLAQLARVRDTARFVIFEAAHGYTANVPLADALKPDNLIAHRLEGRPLSAENGAPVRAVVPDLYFWKSAKWLTSIRFERYDQSGFWERRGYHNHGDPWREQRYS